MEVPVMRNLLEANDAIAEQIRGRLKDKAILALNIISSPGAGKTSLLERTLVDCKNSLRMAVIEGDLQTDNDARRVAATGVQAIQINTGGGCHLNSSMVLEAMQQINLDNLDVLFIENVGNLVCPVEFDCGEDHKIAVLSVTEGDDKPEKYPLLFNVASLMLLNKIDLLPYVDFDSQRACRFARQLHAELPIVPISCKTGEGLTEWYTWLITALDEKKKGQGPYEP